MNILASEYACPGQIEEGLLIEKPASLHNSPTAWVPIGQALHKYHILVQDCFLLRVCILCPCFVCLVDFYSLWAEFEPTTGDLCIPLAHFTNPFRAFCKTV
jgi:hypothetical protein